MIKPYYKLKLCTFNTPNDKKQNLFFTNRSQNDIIVL